MSALIKLRRGVGVRMVGVVIYFLLQFFAFSIAACPVNLSSVEGASPALRWSTDGWPICTRIHTLVMLFMSLLFFALLHYLATPHPSGLLLSQILSLGA